MVEPVNQSVERTGFYSASLRKPRRAHLLVDPLIKQDNFMVNIEKHIEHWKNGSNEDFEVANQLIKSNKIRHGLFFLHLFLKKILKAFI